MCSDSSTSATKASVNAPSNQQHHISEDNAACSGSDISTACHPPSLYEVSLTSIKTSMVGKDQVAASKPDGLIQSNTTSILLASTTTPSNIPRLRRQYRHFSRALRQVERWFASLQRIMANAGAPCQLVQDKASMHQYMDTHQHSPEHNPPQRTRGEETDCRWKLGVYLVLREGLMRWRESVDDVHETETKSNPGM